MSPPVKAPEGPAPQPRTEVQSAETAGHAPQGGSGATGPQGAVLRGQQTAGNSAMSALLGGHGVQRAPNDGEQPPADPVAEAQARGQRRAERGNVQPITDPDEAARIYVNQGANARGNLAIANRGMFVNRWKDHQPYREAPVYGWRNPDGTVVIDKSNPQVRDAVERLASQRGGGGAAPPAPPGGPGGGSPGGGAGGGGQGGGGAGGGGQGGGGGPDRGDPRQSGMAHGPTLNSSGGVATAPTLPGPQRGDPRRSGMAYGPTMNNAGGVATGPTSPGAPAPAPAPGGGGAGPAPAPGPGGPAPGGGGMGPTNVGSDDEGDFDEAAPAPRGKHPDHIKPAVVASVADAQAAFRSDPKLTYRSTNDSTHDQFWSIDPRNRGKAPDVYRTGNTYVIRRSVTGPDLPPQRPVVEADHGMESANIKAMGDALDKRLAQSAPVPVVQPSPGQRRLDPDARRRDPEPGMRQAVPVAHDEVMQTLRSSPDKVYQSKTYGDHADWYRNDRGKGAWPRAWKSGNTIIVDPDYPLDGQRPGPRPGAPAQVTGPDAKTRAQQTISPTGYVPQGQKPTKIEVKDGTLSRETSDEDKRVTDKGTDTRTRSKKDSFNLAKGAGREWKQRDENQTGGKFTANESARKVTATLSGLNFNQGTTTETGTSPDAPRTKVEKNVGGGIGTDGSLTGNASTAITSQTGMKAEAKGDVKLNPDGTIELSGTGQITSPRGFTGHLSVNGKSGAIAKDPKPMPNGKFAVEFVMTDSSGVEIGGGYSKPGGGFNVGLTGGSSTSNQEYEIRVFDTEPQAKAFQMTAAFQVGSAKEDIKKATTAQGALEMKEGEVRGKSQTDTDTLGGSMGMSQVSISVASTDATTEGLKIEKMAGTKIRVTPSVAEQKAFNASISVAGQFGNTKGDSTTDSFAVTYEFDLGTENGKKAFERYCKQRLPPPMPPDAKWIDSTTGHAYEDHDVYKFAHIGEIGWGSQATQTTVEDESGRHTTIVGGQSEKVELNWARRITGDKNRHAESHIFGRMDNGKVSAISAQMTVGGEDGEFNRKQFARIFDDAGAKPGVPYKSSGEWTLSADIDKRMFEELEQNNRRMRQAKTREERFKIYSELAQSGGANMIMGQVRASGKKLAWNLELKGNPNFPGAAGRAQLNAQRAKLAAQLKDKPDSAGSVASEAKDTLDALEKRLAAVSDEQQFTDLPKELRDEQVSLIQTHISEFKSLRSQALSVQMRGGRKEDLTVVLNRASKKDGYKDVAEKDRGWRKAQDLVTAHETEISALEGEIVGTRNVVQTMYRDGRLRRSKGIREDVWQDFKGKIDRSYETAKAMAPMLTAAVGKLREQKDSWSKDEDPKSREDKLRAYDKQLLDVIHIMDAMLMNLQSTAREGYVVTPPSVAENEANEKLWNHLKVDRVARMNVTFGLDELGSYIE